MIGLLLLLFGSPGETPVAEALRARPEDVSTHAGLEARGEPLFTTDTLPGFYAERAFRPVWIRDGELGSAAQELVRALEASVRSGLDPEIYRLEQLEGALQGARASRSDPPTLANLDLLLTDAFLLYGPHVLDARVDVANPSPRWRRVSPSRRPELTELLSSVDERRSITEALASLEPKANDHARLEEALVRYRELASRGGWRGVSEGPKLGQPTLETRVTVGRPGRKTPVFDSQIAYLVLNPHWYVPPNIARRDVLPEVRKGPSHLENVFDGTDAGARELVARAIDWSRVSADALPYYFRQDPGPLNPLGRVKFKLPNPYDVCLHDTPSRRLFARVERTASSGCIRLEKAMELAHRLLAPDWSPQRIVETVERGEELTVPLAHPVQVHLVYLTGRVDEDGTVSFRRDVYQRDAPLDQALLAMSSRWRS